MVNWLKRRVLPLILAVAMLASYLPVSAFAEGDAPTNIWEVSVSDTKLNYLDISAKVKEFAGNIGVWKVLNEQTGDAYNSTDFTKAWTATDGVYKIQEGENHGTLFKPDWVWNDVAQFEMKLYSTLTVNISGFGGSPSGVTVDGEAVTESSKEFRLYAGEQKVVEASEVEGYNPPVVKVGDSEVGTPYTVGYGSDVTVNVTYTPTTSATIFVGETDGATVSYEGQNVSSFNVEGGNTFAVTVTQPASQYVSAVTLVNDEGTSQNGTVTYNKENNNYTVSMPVVNAGEKWTLNVSCEPVIAVPDPFVIPYTPNITKADQLKANILATLGLPEDVDQSKFAIQYTMLDASILTVWLDLTDSNIVGGFTKFEDGDKIKITFAGDDNYPSAEVEVDYSITEARTAVEIKDAKDVVYNYGEAVLQEQLLNAIGAVVYAGDTVVSEPAVTISSESQDTVDKLAAGELDGGVYTIKLEYAGSTQYQKAEAEVTLTINDNRKATEIRVENNPLKISYNPDLTEAELLEQLGVSVVETETGAVIENATVKVTSGLPTDLGDHTITLAYEGNKTDYQGSTNESVTVTVVKADANLTVGSTIVKYGTEVNASDLITVDPEDVQRVEVVVGFGADDNHGTVASAYVNLPFSITDKLEILGPLKEVVIQVLNEFGVDLNKTTFQFEDFKTYITGLKNALDDPRISGIVKQFIDEDSINAVIQLLNAVENLPSIDNMEITLSFDDDIVLKNAGGYLVAGIVSDPNYNQSMNVGAVGIVPDTQYVELAFKNSISNGIVTPDLVTDDYMAAYVKDLDPEDYVNTQVGNIFFGVQDGAFYVDDKASSDFGGYVQIAYLLDVDNTISYALPIARAYAVVPDTAKIVFDGPTEVTYDQNYSITAKVFNKDGSEIQDATPTLYFTGIQSDGKLYSAQKQPDNAGYYTVVATYANDDYTLVAAGATTLTINPAESSITVNDQVCTYDGSSVNVSDMIQASPAKADVAVMVASLSAANGELSNISGTVNIDMPAYVDEVLQKVIPDVYENGLNVETVKKSITDLQTSMKHAGLDGSFLDYVLEMVDQLPSNVNLTFKDGVTCSDVGVYLVTASVFDPNYQFNIDTGILVIAPEVTEADLAWNSEISGGVLTTPMLHDFDFDAQALVDGEKDPDISERIQYLYFGIDASGNVIRDTNPSNLTNGIYTEIAYILEDGTSIAVAKPIVRTFVVHAQDVAVDFLDENGNVSNGGLTVVYDGEPQDVTVRVSDNGTVITPAEGTLTVSYTGVDSLGRFYSDTKAPTQTGYYTVFASYVERDADGELQRVGANITTLTIEPGDATFSLKDTTVDYDGTAKQVTVENPQNLDYITVVVDKDNNVNVVFPASWNVPAKSYDIDQGIDTILATLDKLSGNTNTRSTTLLDNLRQILNSIQIKTLQFNGAYPVNIGTYKFSALAFSENYKPVTASATLTIQEKPVTPTEPSNPGDSGSSGNSGNTQTVTSSGSSSSDNQTQSTPAPAATVTIPQTGDTMPVGLLIGLVVAAAVALTVLVVVRKRKRN